MFCRKMVEIVKMQDFVIRLAVRDTSSLEWGNANGNKKAKDNMTTATNNGNGLGQTSEAACRGEWKREKKNINKENSTNYFEWRTGLFIGISLRVFVSCLPSTSRRGSARDIVCLLYVNRLMRYKFNFFFSGIVISSFHNVFCLFFYFVGCFRCANSCASKRLTAIRKFWMNVLGHCSPLKVNVCWNWHSAHFIWLLWCWHIGNIGVSNSLSMPSHWYYCANVQRLRRGLRMV